MPNEMVVTIWKTHADIHRNMISAQHIDNDNHLSYVHDVRQIDYDYDNPRMLM